MLNKEKEAIYKVLADYLAWREKNAEMSNHEEVAISFKKAREELNLALFPPPVPKKKRNFLGMFATTKEALAYNEAIIKLNGKFAQLNVIPPKPPKKKQCPMCELRKENSLPLCSTHRARKPKGRPKKKSKK